MAVERVHNYLWGNSLNRTYIISILMVLWTLFIELYFLFWPIEEAERNLVVGFLFTDIFGTTLLLDLFHSIVWSLCIFFSWIFYTLLKQLTNSNPAGIIKFLALIILFAFFILFINNVFVMGLVIVLALGEFGYMYLALAD